MGCKGNKATLTILTSGRISSQKNPSLFNAIALSFKDYPQVSFVWVGEGELSHCLTANNITITGWVSKEETNKYYSVADIYLSTALWEGLPFL
ncbi:MAG: glycosyltransferase [Cytophagaceae bacterium]|nr:glycosyltransferase [Cytophagaceae bacterium]